MTTTRSYGDGCSIARALDVVGERWALLLVRELLLGPKRHADLRRGLPQLSPNVLSQRLRELEQAGVLRRRRLPPPAGTQVYELTEWGLELEPVVLSLGRWSAAGPAPASAAPVVSADSVALALRGRFDPAAADGMHAALELHMGPDRFAVTLADRALTVARGEHEQPDATIEADPPTLDAVLWGDRPATALRVDGDEKVAARFVALYAA